MLFVLIKKFKKIAQQQQLHTFKIHHVLILLYHLINHCPHRFYLNFSVLLNI